MKRRRFLQGLALAPPLILGACKKDLLPKTATIITGKILDEKGKPIENVPLKLDGYHFSEGSIAGGVGTRENTFKFEKNSDKNGFFEFSQVFPEKTAISYLLIGDLSTSSFFEIQVKKNGVKFSIYTEITIYPSAIIVLGEKNEIEIILTKK
jgi:hypothetical protein